MSDNSWINEPESGRWYVLWKDEYGRDIRRYSDELDERTPRSESSSGATRRTVAQSVNPPRTSGRRRGSEASTTRVEQPRVDSRSQPISIYSKSPRYHESGTQDHRRDGHSYHRSDGYDTHKDSTDRRPSVSRHASEKYDDGRAPDRSYDGGADTLHKGMADLTVDEVVGQPQYISVSSSVPVERSRWDGLPHRTQDGIFDKGLGVTNTLVGQNPQQYGQGKTVPVDPRGASASPAQTKRHVVVGTQGKQEKLDKSYKMRNTDYKTFFKPGRVFKTLWTDPWAGKTNGSVASENNQFMSVVKYDEKVHSKIRRFVVVRQGNQFCTCLPVTTYDGRGYTKNGINLDQHGLIYTSERSPKRVEGIVKEPLKLKLSNEKGAETLVNPSYINYARVYTVETNVKVKDVGELDSASRKLLRAYFNQVNILYDDEYEGTMPTQTPQSKAADFAYLGAGINDSAQQGYSVRPDDGRSSGYHQPSTYNPLNRAGPQPGYFAPLGHNNATNFGVHPGYNTAPTYSSQGGRTERPGSGGYPSQPSYDMLGNQSASGYPSSDPRYQQRGSGIATVSPASVSANNQPSYSSGEDLQSPRRSTGFDPYLAGSSFAPSDQYPTQDYPPGFHSSTPQVVSSTPHYAPGTTPGGTLYPSNQVNVDRRPPLSGSGQGTSASHRPSTFDEESIKLPTLDEVQASRSGRDGVVSSSRSHRGSARDRDRDRDRERAPPRDRDSRDRESRDKGPRERDPRDHRDRDKSRR